MAAPGGTLVIDRTEAMTVVDVNTGKFTGAGGNLEQTVTKNNIEAAEEIVRQLRLRDIGGIVVIDFIDMVLESNRDLVLRRLTEALAWDRTRHQVSEVTSLGLVQLTRKRLGTGLVEAFSTTCTHCAGGASSRTPIPVDNAWPARAAHRRTASPSRAWQHQPLGRGGKKARADEPAPAVAKVPPHTVGDHRRSRRWLRQTVSTTTSTASPTSRTSRTSRRSPPRCPRTTSMTPSMSRPTARDDEADDVEDSELDLDEDDEDSDDDLDDIDLDDSDEDTDEDSDDEDTDEDSDDEDDRGRGRRGSDEDPRISRTRILGRRGRRGRGSRTRRVGRSAPAASRGCPTCGSAPAEASSRAV